MVNEQYILHPYYSTVFADTVREVMENPPVSFGHSGSWDTLAFPDGYEKPSKELLEERFKENYRNEGFKYLRIERNKKLTESDFVIFPDYSHSTPEIKQAWLDYRQALRDLTDSVTEDPENPNWPTPPN